MLLLGRFMLPFVIFFSSRWSFAISFSLTLHVSPRLRRFRRLKFFGFLHFSVSSCAQRLFFFARSHGVCRPVLSVNRFHYNWLPFAWDWCWALMLAFSQHRNRPPYVRSVSISRGFLACIGTRHGMNCWLKKGFTEVFIKNHQFEGNAHKLRQ